MNHGDIIKCLDHGHVQLVDCMGDDKAVVDAARVSLAGGTLRPVNEDRGLIRYLMRMRHTTPFEMVVFKFRVKAPIFVFRQWHRHRMASINEMSARYSELPECYYTPEPEHVEYQATTNKQGRTGVMEDANAHRAAFRAEASLAFEAYKVRLDAGMSRELARINLPVGAYSEMIWKCDLHNLLHFLGLRMDKHAQYEIRVFAEAIAEFVKARCPLSWEAFEDFRLNAVTFSVVEMKALRSAVDEAEALHADMDWPTKREREEFEAKLARLVRTPGSNID